MIDGILLWRFKRINLVKSFDSFNPTPPFSPKLYQIEKHSQDYMLENDL